MGVFHSAFKLLTLECGRAAATDGVRGVNMHYVCTESNLADMLKLLACEQLELLVEQSVPSL